MAKEDIANLDASVRAAFELQSVLSKNKTNPTKRVSVENALSGPRVVTEEVKRVAARVLFISRDESLLNPEKQSLDGFLNLSDMFEEVHIIILREGITPNNPVLRAGSNVWLYTAAARHWFLTPLSAMDLVREQLVFAEGFRPDLIVARDPFESALTAHMLAKKYHRPTQLHILEEYTNPAFVHRHRHNRWRLFLARYTVSKFKSIRVATDTLCRNVSKRYPKVDLAVLPRYQDYHKVIEAKSTIDLQAVYKPFLFIMLFIGKLTHESTLFRAIDAARFALRNPRVGLVVLGDGPGKPEFQKRAKILGVEKQIVFENRVSDIIPYLKSAQLLIATDTTAVSDEIIYTAAAAGMPLVISKTPQRLDVFENGVSAFLCEPEDTQAFAEGISFLLNNEAQRKVLSRGAVDAVERKFHQHPHVYRKAYQETIENALFIDDEPLG